MKLEQGQFIQTDWYVTQEGNKKATDLIFKDFCDYIIVIKTFAENVEVISDAAQILETKIVHINSNNGEVTFKTKEELDPPLLEIIEKTKFPFFNFG
jgi:hypothetical protein